MLASADHPDPARPSATSHIDGAGADLASARSSWPTLLADVLVAPRTAFRPLADRPGLLVPLACLAGVKYLGLFPHFAPSLVPAQIALAVAAQGVSALATATVWAAIACAGLACLGGAPRYRTMASLFLVAALWPEVAGAVVEAGVVAAGAYPAALDAHVDHVTSLVWLVPADAGPSIRGLANALDGSEAYRDVLVALGLPQVSPTISQRTAVALVVALRCVRIVVAAAHT